MRSVLLLGTDLLPGCQVVVVVGLVGHGKRSSLHSDCSMHIIVHIKYFLLLSCKGLILCLSVSLIYHCKSHGSWDKNVVWFWWINLTLDIIISRILPTFKLWEMSRWFVTVIVSHISSILIHVVFLIVTVKFLDIETSSSLIISKSCCWTWFKWNITSSSTLSMKMFSKIYSWRFVLSDIASLLRSIIHMINIILLLETSISVLLVFEDLSQNTLCLNICSINFSIISL